MLGKKDKKDPAPSTGVINVIGEGTHIVGDISSNGDLRIDGTVVGNVLTSGKCVLGITGAITGDIVQKMQILMVTFTVILPSKACCS